MSQNFCARRLHSAHLSEMADDDFELPDAEEVEEAGEEVDYYPATVGKVQELIKGGGLQKVVTKAGEGWETPDTGDEVSG